MQGYDIKQKIESYFNGSNETMPVHQDERLNRSCPPPQQTSAQSLKASAFQPFNRNQESASKANNDIHESRTSSMNRNSFGNHAGGLGSSLIQKPHSSSGTYMSANSVEQSNENYNQHSKFLSPTLKQMGPKQDSGSRQFGNDVFNGFQRDSRMSSFANNEQQLFGENYKY